MGQAERASEEFSPMIAYNRNLAAMEADLAVLAAGAIGTAEVDVRVDIDESKIYPSIPPTLVAIRRQDDREDVTDVNFTYTSEYLGTGSPRVAKARLQQATSTEKGFRVVNDRLVLGSSADKPLVRHREIRVKAPGYNEESDIIKQASFRTVLAMAKLAAYHARVGHENPQNT